MGHHHSKLRAIGISWAGQPTPELLRRAIVFQRPAMLRRSVAANIRYALRAAGIPRARHIAAEAELLIRVGLERLGRRPARRLSSGEQQRLAIARALALDPAVLFLDEPTANLDPAGTKAIEDIIRDIARLGIKVVFSTHDFGEAKRLAGQVVLLHRGRVIEVGTVPMFFDAPRTEDARKFLSGELLV